MKQCTIENLLIIFPYVTIFCILFYPNLYIIITLFQQNLQTFPISMQLALKPSELFNLTQDNFIICSGTDYKAIIKNINRSAEALSILGKIINTMGERSATSQGLKQVITSLTKFSGTNQRIYIKIEGTQAVGFVKAGERNLFYRDYVGNIKQIQPTCVLDIYVHQSCQRTGYGKQIFEKFLKCEKQQPAKLAYDRPSPKLISFLKKHYQLVDYIPQNNNYVIFNKFFSSNNVNTGRNGSNAERNKTVSNFNENYQSKIGNFNSFNSKQQFESRKQKQNKECKLDISLKTEGRITDSLQLLASQIQRTKSRNTINIPISPAFIEEIRLQTKTQKIVNNELASISNGFGTNGRYSLNMKLKDLSYRIPWATQAQDQNTVFRTTSNPYGNYAYF